MLVILCYLCFFGGWCHVGWRQWNSWISLKTFRTLLARTKQGSYSGPKWQWQDHQKKNRQDFGFPITIFSGVLLRIALLITDLRFFEIWGRVLTKRAQPMYVARLDRNKRSVALLKSASGQTNRDELGTERVMKPDTWKIYTTALYLFQGFVNHESRTNVVKWHCCFKKVVLKPSVFKCNL